MKREHELCYNHCFIFKQLNGRLYFNMRNKDDKNLPSVFITVKIALMSSFLSVLVLGFRSVEHISTTSTGSVFGLRLRGHIHNYPCRTIRMCFHMPDEVSRCWFCILYFHITDIAFGESFVLALCEFLNNQKWYKRYISCRKWALRGVVLKCAHLSLLPVSQTHNRLQTY